MSMLRAFEKLLNPDVDEREARDQRAEVERAKQNADGPPPRRCKACAYEGTEQYCPHCLADTMQMIRSRPRRPIQRR